MMNLHILSDPVSDFWKCPKKGFKKKLFMVFFSSEFYRQTSATITRRHTWGLSGNQLFPRYEDDFERRLHSEGTENFVGEVAIVVVICGEMCGKIKKLSDWNKNLCASRYWPCCYDSADKKTKRQKRQQDKNTKRQKDKKDKNTKKTKKAKRQKDKKDTQKYKKKYKKKYIYIYILAPKVLVCLYFSNKKVSLHVPTKAV